MKQISLSYGSGGKLTYEFITQYILKYFSNPLLEELLDSAVIKKDLFSTDRIAFTIDGYTINPIFFAGGDIGKLSICGTINDLVAVGAEPKLIACSLIIQEGLEFEVIEKVLSSIRNVCETENVKIVTGDTKVVERTACDKIFITTSGIGIIKDNVKLGYDRIKPEDKIIVTGNIAEHGFAILLSRGSYGFEYDIKSDCASLYPLMKKIFDSEYAVELKFLRDATRGGIAAVLNEIVKQNKNVGIELIEENIPVSDEVKSISDILGIDPLYVANEGKMVIITSDSSAEKIVEILTSHPLGKNSKIIGKVTDTYKGKVVMKTLYGAYRIIDMPTAEQLPRIC